MQLKNYKKIIKTVLGIFVFGILFSSYFSTVSAETIDELQQKINFQAQKLKELDKEIEENTKKLLETNQKANTLQNTVNNLSATENKIEKDISHTENTIEKTELTIEKIGLEIGEKQKLVNNNNYALAEVIKTLNEIEQTSLIESIFLFDDFSDLWNSLYSIQQFKKSILDFSAALIDSNRELKGKKQANEVEKKELTYLTRELEGEKEVIVDTKKAKANVLASTRNEESAYKNILAQKTAQRKAFEAALLEFESQLQTLIDPDSFPDAGRGIFSWPVSPIIVTQLFGGTQFAKSNPGVYGRPFHNGTDFGIPIGTKVKAVLSGTVQATGNTDAFPGCNSWGKWVLVKHNNGLTTLYAHLSSILVSPGESIQTGGTLALSGNTGFSTGPHLHLTAYASQGVEVRKFSEFGKGGTGCSATGASTPVAPLDAYLDPMSYLPSL